MSKIEWNGDINEDGYPEGVYDTTEVIVYLRNNTIEHGPVYIFDWVHIKDDPASAKYDIIAYEVVIE